MLSIQLLTPRQSWSPRPCVRYQNGNSQALEYILHKINFTNLLNNNNNNNNNFI